MALTFKSVKTLNPTHLTIIKNAQIWGHIMTNRTAHPYATYTPLKDPQFHLNPGDQLEILEIQKVDLLVRNSRGQEFKIFKDDIPRFLAL